MVLMMVVAIRVIGIVVVVVSGVIGGFSGGDVNGGMAVLVATIS